MDTPIKTGIPRPSLAPMKIILVYALLILIYSAGFCQNLDIRLLKEINLNRNKSLDPAFRTLSKTATPMSFIVPITVVSIGLIKNEDRLKVKGLIIGESILVASIITTSLKYSIHRERPFVTYPAIENTVSAGSPSFPSGHTSTSFATATSLSMAFHKWYVIAPAFIWAGAIGYSRMDLGVHYPSDVLAGALMGCGSIILTNKINKWMNKKHSKKLNNIKQTSLPAITLFH